jgi:hypothetical protein
MTGTRHRVTRFALASLVTTTLLAVAVFPSISAGSQSSPEIMDAAGDVSPATFASNETIDNATINALYQNETAYDVVKAWIGLETEHDFLLFIEVRDLPDGWSALGNPPAESPFGANLSHAGTSLVANFSIAGLTYQAVAKLAMPSAGKLFDNYTVWHDGARGDVSGSYNTTEDWVAMKLPKSAFPGLADGMRLTNFWIQGRFANMSMDYAPNARDSLGGTPDPVVLLGKIQGGSLVMPNYGADYYFGQYYHPSGSGGGSGNWPAVPNIQLAALDGASTIDPGESAVYEMRVTNAASAKDTVYFVLNSAKAGWAHQVSESQVVLAPGASKIISLTVSASDDATGSFESILSASSALGAESDVAVTTLIAKELVDSEEKPAGSFDPTPGSSDAKGGSPGFELIGLVAAAAAAVFLVRRRK